MATARAESQHPPHGRKRANTTLLPAPPLRVGDTQALSLWVHDTATADVVFNPDWWPGVAAGDTIQVTADKRGGAPGRSGFLFTVRLDDEYKYPNLQISVARHIAEAFDLRNHEEVTLTKVDQSKNCADYIEIVFQDQYLGRCDMWRLGKQLQGQCVHLGQSISFVGSVAGKVQNIYIGGKKVSAGCVTSLTKAIYRSLSAKMTIFIQVCRELWEFAGDGERYNEKIVHSFLPALFRKWREAGTNHIVTIVLISRVYYKQSEIDYAAGPLRQDEEGSWYKDFFKIITDLAVVQDWKPKLVSLKDSFWAFQRDILLTHHYHRASLFAAPLEASTDPPEQVRLVGRLSFAQDGPILEALNLALNPTETHYIDRSLSLTGAATILITPGPGYYRVSKRLLRLTTTRMLDQGVSLDLVALAKPPLHRSPLFSFRGTEPELRGGAGARALDPLWGGEDDPADAGAREKTTFWWEPFWVSVSFWDQQLDLPFREDRFIARAKMHQIQMLGLLEHDVLSSIVVPFLSDNCDPLSTPRDELPMDPRAASRLDADAFDCRQFVLRRGPVHAGSRGSAASSGGATATAAPSSLRAHEKRVSILHRNSMSSRIAPIEESPRTIYMELPPEGDAEPPPPYHDHIRLLSTSPSQASILSNRSATSENSLSEKHAQGPPQTSLTSKLASSWLFNPFRSGSSQAQTSTLSVAAASSATAHSTALTTPSLAFSRLPASTAMPMAQSRPPKPVAIKGTPSRRSTLTQRPEDDGASSARNSYTRHSPLHVSPRDDPAFAPRRGTVSSLSAGTPASAHAQRTSPLRPGTAVPYTHSSLASRWRHVFPQPVLRHQLKWTSMVTPACLPLTTEHFPTKGELETSYDVFSYDFVVDPPEMRSFLIRPPPAAREAAEQARTAWALVVMRGMAALRLAQGFQFVIRPGGAPPAEDRKARDSRYFVVDDDKTPKPAGASEIFQSTIEPVYLSMSNEIHRISYSDEAIQVRRYVRRMPPAQPFNYQCLVWPKLGVGYTELSTSFTSHGLENYGWNRVDMLVAGYEHQFNESLRYWRTRFIVIPTIEPPPPQNGPSGEKLDHEEVRLMGMDKLAELFSRVRWVPPGERVGAYPPVRFLPTYLGPAAAVLDEQLLAQLEEIHAAGPLGKKMKSERDVGELSLPALAKAMREDGALPIKDYRWHGALYQDSFTGYDFVSWLVREFRDVATREYGVECGARLQEQGLFEHCRGLHGFLDGHYFYRLKGEYAVLRTPRGGGWFRSVRHVSGEEKDGVTSGRYPSNMPRHNAQMSRRNKRRIVLSQTMIIDVDHQKKSDQAESVILHYDLMHNPANVFHFELNWIGTTARCIEDLLRLWGRTIERYGLKLVEAYVTQIADIRERNPFQSCFPLRLAVPAPVVPDLEKRVPEGTQTGHYFERALLRRLHFVLDLEGAAQYPERVDVLYSYRRAATTHSQFVHRTGVAFVQVLGGAEGFLFLTNRLMAPGRMGASFRGLWPAAAAEDLRVQLAEFCADREALNGFYDEELAALPPARVEDPPELEI